MIEIWSEGFSSKFIKSYYFRSQSYYNKRLLLNYIQLTINHIPIKNNIMSYLLKTYFLMNSTWLNRKFTIILYVLLYEKRVKVNFRVEFALWLLIYTIPVTFGVYFN